MEAPHAIYRPGVQKAVSEPAVNVTVWIGFSTGLVLRPCLVHGPVDKNSFRVRVQQSSPSLPLLLSESTQGWPALDSRYRLALVSSDRRHGPHALLSEPNRHHQQVLAVRAGRKQTCCVCIRGRDGRARKQEIHKHGRHRKEKKEQRAGGWCKRRQVYARSSSPLIGCFVQQHCVDLGLSQGMIANVTL